MTNSPVRSWSIVLFAISSSTVVVNLCSTWDFNSLRYLIYLVKSSDCSSGRPMMTWRDSLSARKERQVPRVARCAVFINWISFMPFWDESNSFNCSSDIHSFSKEFRTFWDLMSTTMSSSQTMGTYDNICNRSTACFKIWFTLSASIPVSVFITKQIVQFTNTDDKQTEMRSQWNVEIAIPHQMRALKIGKRQIRRTVETKRFLDGQTPHNEDAVNCVFHAPWCLFLIIKDYI